MTAHYRSRIAPFGYLRVNGYLHLSAAFRSLSRPSSADIAKASTVCSYYLSLCKIHTLTFLAFKIVFVSVLLEFFLRYVGKYFSRMFPFFFVKCFLSYSFFYTVFKEHFLKIAFEFFLTCLSGERNGSLKTEQYFKLFLKRCSTNISIEFLLGMSP